MAKWHGINFGNKIRQSSNILKGIQKTGNTLRFTKGDDTTEDINLGTGGGGLTETPLANISGRWTWSSSDDGERVFTGNIIYGILNDGQRIWISTNKGIASYNPLNAHVNSYLEVNGLVSNEFNSNAFFNSSNGELYSQHSIHLA